MLIDDIRLKMNQIQSAMYNLEQLKQDLRTLECERMKCDHTFSAPIPGYEHEGGTCTQCGINEVHAHSMKIGAKYRG